MKNETFVDKVKRHFDFLETEYRFKVVFARESEVRPQTDGVVKYASSTTLIIIDSETGQAAIKFLRALDEERYYLDPVLIHEYLNTTDQEKQILLSREKGDDESAKTIFNKSFLLSSAGWVNINRDDVLGNLDVRLRNYSTWLKQNAKLCLLGDFSKWPAFYKYKIDRLTANELRAGGKEVAKAVVRDENGTLKTIERPIYQREKDHLAKLEKEILG